MRQVGVISGHRALAVAAAFGAAWLLLGSGGCAHELTPAAKALLESGYTALDAGENQLVVERMDAFLASNARSRRVAEGYYLRGVARGNLGQSEAARADLEQAIEAASQRDVLAGALVAMGDLDFQAGGYESAAMNYARALGQIDRGQKPSDRAHFMLGDSLQRLGQWQAADPHFDRVIFYFGDSPLGQEAQRRTHCTAWTVFVGSWPQRSQAQRQQERLTEAGIGGVAVTARQRQGQLEFAVSAGRFARFADALGALGAVAAVEPEARIEAAR